MEKLSALWATVQENVAYLLVCLLVFVGLFVVAVLVENIGQTDATTLPVSLLPVAQPISVFSALWRRC